MTDWLEHEWRIAGGLTGVLALLLSVARLLRSSSVARPPFWRRVFQAGSAIVRLQIADGEIDYLKSVLTSVRLERSQLLEDSARKDLIIAQLRTRLGEVPGTDLSAGSTKRRGANTRKKRTTSGTSGESTQ